VKGEGVEVEGYGRWGDGGREDMERGMEQGGREERLVREDSADIN
jgi:hypothetical protein